MGLSRPGVESTLFRARKRLTEEYDELVSGQRCARIQSIIASAEQETPGARDTRRLARHIAHCQPCRREAIASGLDAAVLAHNPVRRRIAERVAGLLPLPGFLRTRIWGGSEQMVPMSEPMASSWDKAVAAAATLLVAGVGAGVVPHNGGAADRVEPAKAKPAAVVKKAAAGVSTTRARPLSVTQRPARTHATTTGRVSRRHGKTLGAPSGFSNSHAGGTPQSGAPASGGTRASAPTVPAAVNPGGSAPSP